MVTDAMRSFWAEPAVADPPAPMRRDWLLVGVFLPVAIAETVLRDDLVWPAPSLLLAFVFAAVLPIRRSRSLLAVVATFGAIEIVEAASLFAGVEVDGLYSMIVVLVLPYALFRWASGRHRVLGLAVMEVAALLSIVNAPLDEAIGGPLILLVPAFLGGMVRSERNAREREVAQVKSAEREQIARELHDTVAHHVSAIAIQAQAGQATAPARPSAALEALAIIEAEASRTLAEMRSIVGALRDHDEPEFAPQPGIRDLSQLAGTGAVGPPVTVVVEGDTAAVGPALDAAVYRLVQESVTNALRHAHDASSIDVRVQIADDCVRLTVDDDGASTGPASPAGYGLVGMAERASLLGGSFEAGPRPARGWSVQASLPRSGVAT